jgi:hypothetical protein
MVHKEDCPELAATTDWVPFEEVSEESLEGLNVKKCSECME